MNDTSTSKDREELHELLAKIEKELDYVISAIEKDPHLIPHWLNWSKSMIRDDWTKARPAFVHAKESLASVKDEELGNHGLIGAPLKSKIRFLETVTKRVRWQLSRIHYPARPILRKSLAWLLKVQDNLLDSMASVLPPLGVVTELKKQLESALTFPDVME